MSAPRFGMRRRLLLAQTLVLLAGGVTTANIMPGSGNVIGGQTLYVKLRGHTVDEMRIANMKTLGGLKMANGENPKGYGKKGLAPVTRMKVTALISSPAYRAKKTCHEPRALLQPLCIQPLHRKLP